MKRQKGNLVRSPVIVLGPNILVHLISSAAGRWREVVRHRILNVDSTYSKLKERIKGSLSH